VRQEGSIGTLLRAQSRVQLKGAPIYRIVKGISLERVTRRLRELETFVRVCRIVVSKYQARMLVRRVLVKFDVRRATHGHVIKTSELAATLRVYAGEDLLIITLRKCVDPLLFNKFNH
jgi:hypothetical protein